MKAEQVVRHFVEMCYSKGVYHSEKSGNYKAFRSGADNLPCLTLFGNRIAWLKASWGDTLDIIATSDCGWRTRTTHKALGWVRWYASSAQSDRQQHDLFDETS